ncbi:hypothetical protein D3C86_1845380 [compost metagenome]
MHTLVWLERGDRLAFPVHGAFLRWQQTHQAFEQGGLAHAISAEQAGDFADLHVKRQAAQDVASAVVLVQLFDLQHFQILLRSPVGASLLAMASAHSILLLTDTPLSRASSLPQLDRCLQV